MVEHAIAQGQPATGAPGPTAKQQLDAAAEVPAARLLVSLLQLTLFSDLFCHLAYRRHVHQRLEARVEAMIKGHPRYYKFCRWADFLARLLILVIIVVLGAAFAGGVIYRAFYLPQSSP